MFFDDLKLFGLQTEFSIGDIFSIIQGKILNMGGELSKMYIIITDTFGNLFSVITIFYYMIQGGIQTADTIFNENITGINYSKRSFIINFLSSVRQKIDDPLGKKRVKN